jgi:hypothetical protein
MTEWPSKKHVLFDTLIRDYGATNFRAELALFIVKLTKPRLRGAQLGEAMSQFVFHFNAVHVFHKIKYKG